MTDLTLRLTDLTDSLRRELDSERQDKQDILQAHASLVQDITLMRVRLDRKVRELSGSEIASPEASALRAYEEVRSWL